MLEGYIISIVILLCVLGFALPVTIKACKDSLAGDDLALLIILYGGVLTIFCVGLIIVFIVLIIQL